ncbi:MAG: metal-dependent transcriptional regulator [Crocinitomicaceae bacterium]|nr:metal-dependent transcriptional regulator [Crocinitomicaceae bacterium]
MLSFTEENYLKALVELTVLDADSDEVGVNALASSLDVKPATASDMVRKLRDKTLVNYKKYGKVSLTDTGRFKGMMVIRRHRLWETFLSSKLDFSWDEVHELAEELEHIHSEKLINRLDEFLDFPEFDPHGDAIPNKDGEILLPFRRTLSEAEVGKKHKISAVRDQIEVLQYMDRIQLKINQDVTIDHREAFDGLTTITYGKQTSVVSPKLTENIFVVCSTCGKAKCTC